MANLGLAGKYFEKKLFLLSDLRLVLGIEREGFNKSDLAKVYRKLARKFHPDRVKDEVLLVKYFVANFDYF